MLNRAFYPQLDSLRAFAILFVLVYHWFPQDSLINILPNGGIGVTLFFVISGFLISKILIENRLKIESGRSSLSSTYKNFVIRRALRIFPIYYLFITIIYFAFSHLSDIRTEPLYYYLYGYNFLLDKTGNWADVLSPFWTLAVEEQFYVLWPLVILLTPTRHTLKVIVFFIILGPFSRFFDHNGLTMPTCFDCFGMGALWAYFVVLAPSQASVFRQYIGWAAAIALPVFLFIVFGKEAAYAIKGTFYRLSMSVIFLFLVIQTTIGVNQPLIKAILEHRFLKHIGKISYGMYVYHIMVPITLTPLVVKAALKIGINLTNSYIFTMLSFILLIIVSTISWQYIEKPINDLKKKFEYKK